MFPLFEIVRENREDCKISSTTKNPECYRARDFFVYFVPQTDGLPFGIRAHISYGQALTELYILNTFILPNINRHYCLP